MKGLALETIAYFIIALVTIIIILTLIGTKLSPSIRNAYCSFVRGLRGLLPIPSYMKPPLPSYCQMEQITFKTEIIESNKASYVRDHLAAYIIACWETTGKLNVGQDKICYEVVLRNNLDMPLTENDIVSVLAQEGYENIMTWNRDNIIEKGSIAISYNSTSKKIEVS